eukprot:scaffold19285_cov75-Attheya_sp.AAC.1
MPLRGPGFLPLRVIPTGYAGTMALWEEYPHGNYFSHEYYPIGCVGITMAMWSSSMRESMPLRKSRDYSRRIMKLAISWINDAVRSELSTLARFLLVLEHVVSKNLQGEKTLYFGT